MTKLKVPKTFVPTQDLEEKIEKLSKQIEEIKPKDCIISTTCCMHKEHNIILKFENGTPTDIICTSYKQPGYDYSCWEGSKQECIYLSGFKSLKNEKGDYQK